MCKLWIISLVIVAALAVSSDIHAQSPAGAGSDKTTPNLSGICEAPYDLPPGGQERFDLCGEPGCGDFAGTPPLAHDVTVEEPQMLPWTEEKYTAAREGVPEAVPFARQQANPYFSACTTLGPSALLLAFFNFVELRQFPDVVFLFVGGVAGESDHAVRRIYVDGRGHPSDLKPTSMGHSIGRYDGDTLVVDTIGINSINGNRWIDLQGHPHTDALHLVERFRRVDQKTLEYAVTIDDPQAYKNS